MSFLEIGANFPIFLYCLWRQMGNFTVEFVYFNVRKSLTFPDGSNWTRQLLQGCWWCWTQTPCSPNCVGGLPFPSLTASRNREHRTSQQWPNPHGSTIPHCTLWAFCRAFSVGLPQFPCRHSCSHILEMTPRLQMSYGWFSFSHSSQTPTSTPQNWAPFPWCSCILSERHKQFHSLSDCCGFFAFLLHPN